MLARGCSLSKNLVISQHAVRRWRSKNRKVQNALKRVAIARPGQRMRRKKIAYDPLLGLNFAVNVEFWLCNEDFDKKLKSITCDFWACSMTSKTAIFVLVKMQTMILSTNRWFFWVYWLPQSEELTSHYTQLIVEPKFARLRKFQFFKAVAYVIPGKPV